MTDPSAVAASAAANVVPYIAPDQPPKCTWHQYRNVDAQIRSKNDPHRHRDRQAGSLPKIYSNILEQIGNTPLVRLANIEKHYGLKCELLGKCEFFNAGGSVKDRIGLRMVLDAERDGVIRPGWTLIEPTSGNTGIGLALAAAVKGYKCIIVMPEKMSNEKVNVLRALGAEIIRTPTSARYDAANSHIRVAQKLQTQIKNSIILDQYRNMANPLAHYDTTGAEILEQTGSRLDMIVLGAGTGGTVTGIGRRLKESLPNCKVVAVDPIGSILAEPEELNQSDVSFYEVEGIGYDFIPTVLDRSVVDRWVKMDDKRSLTMARNLIRMEGILCGGSSGTAVAAAVEVAKDLPAGSRVVVILPDGVRNYMTKFLDDEWMENRNFDYPNRKLASQTTEPWYYREPIEKLVQGMFVTTISETEKCITAIRLMKVNGFDQLPVVPGGTDTKRPLLLLGMVTVGDIMAKISAGIATLESPVSKVLQTNYPLVRVAEPFGVLIKKLNTAPYVAVVDSASGNGGEGRWHISGIVTHIDVLDYITKVDGGGGGGAHQ